MFFVCHRSVGSPHPSVIFPLNPAFNSQTVLLTGFSFLPPARPPFLPGLPRPRDGIEASDLAGGSAALSYGTRYQYTAVPDLTSSSK